MPGIFGFNRSNATDPASVELTLRRMAEPLCCNPSQSVEVFPEPRFACGTVNLGNDFAFQRPASAQRNGVRVVVDGEFFPDACEVPAELAGTTPTIQRAEYCLHLYLQHGLACVEKLNGTFGLAILDSRDGRIHLAADRFGHRWMFFWAKDQACAFASSVRSLLLHRDDIGRSYDQRGLAEMFVLERVLEDRTLFSDIKRLRGGHLATWTGQRWETAPYYQARHTGATTKLKSWREASEELARQIRRSLEKRLADRQKTGLFLSGGLDSRLVLGCCPNPSAISTFTYSFPDGIPAEAGVSRRLASAVGAPSILLERGADYYAAIAARSSELNEGLSSFVGSHTIGLHQRIRESGVRVLLTGDRSDVAFKDYFSGVLDTGDLSPWTGSLLQRRRAARKLIGSPIIRRAHRQDLMMLGLNSSMKMELAAANELCLENLQEMLRSNSLEEALAVIGLSDWQGFTSLAFIRGSATEFVERSPFFDNAIWDLALSIPTAWRREARIVRRAISLVSKPLARTPDISTGIPPALPWPWDGRLAKCRQFIRNCGKTASKYSKSIQALRPPPSGARIFTDTGSHDRNAALRQSPEYRNLVIASIALLPDTFFDVAAIRQLLEEDLAAPLPSHASLFEMVVSFAQFRRNWAPDLPRPARARPSPASINIAQTAASPGGPAS